MKKVYLLMVILVLFIAACCKNNTPELDVTLLDQEGKEVSFPQDRPVVFFFFDTYRELNSQNQLITLHKNLNKLEDIDANIYLVSKDSPEELKKFQIGIKKLTGESLEFLSDPFIQLGEFSGLKDDDTLLEGYAILSKSGKIVYSLKNDKFGIELNEVATNIEKHYKSKDVIKVANTNDEEKRETTEDKEDKPKEEPITDSEVKGSSTGGDISNDKPQNEQNNGEVKDNENNEEVVDSDNNNNETPQPIEEIEKVYHPVVSGDTLSKISLQYNVPIEVIKQNNNVEENTIFIGQELFIYEMVSIEGNVTIKMNHKITAGEALDDIAQKYNTTTKKIMEDNNISDSIVYPGQELIINISK